MILPVAVEGELILSRTPLISLHEVCSGYFRCWSCCAFWGCDTLTGGAPVVCWSSCHLVTVWFTRIVALLWMNPCADFTKFTAFTVKQYMLSKNWRRENINWLLWFELVTAFSFFLLLSLGGLIRFIWFRLIKVFPALNSKSFYISSFFFLLFCFNCLALFNTQFWFVSFLTCTRGWIFLGGWRSGSK